MIWHQTRLVQVICREQKTIVPNCPISFIRVWNKYYLGMRIIPELLLVWWRWQLYFIGLGCMKL